MNCVILLSGGTGTRMNMDIPKQYIVVHNKPIFMYAYESIVNCKYIDAVCIVADQSWHKDIKSWISRTVTDKICIFADPGETRQLSILNGLNSIERYMNDSDYVLIHDAARPLLSRNLINKCFESIEECDGVIPVLPMKDTVYLSIEGRVVEQLTERQHLYAGQAPELFIYGKYYEANKELLPHNIYKINGSTEPAVLYGMNIKMIDGEEINFKITTQSDLERFADIIGG